MTSLRFGVDEAGRGPVLGAMFAAAVVADPDALPDGVRDSKRLTPVRREEIAGALRADSSVDIGVASVPTERIDAPESDMNSLTVEAQATALSVALDGTDCSEGVVDACDTDAARFGARVADRLDADVTVRAEHGADDAYPLVSAASVVAKVERDAHVADLAAEYGEVGSGYPGDGTTRRFLREYVEDHGDLPGCARRSWGTCEDVLAAAEQSSLDSF
jgi:ribonuclease HII